MLAFSLVLAGAAAFGDAHSAANPVFSQLVEKGVSPSGETFFPLPSPILPDGLSAAQQRKIVAELDAPRSSYEQMTRNSVVAPHVLRMSEIATGDPKTPLKAVDLYFVAYGDMDALADKDFLTNALRENQQAEAGEAEKLKPEELAERNIEVATEETDREAYSRTMMEMLDRVELNVVARTYASRTEDSLVTAAIVDPRFSDDKKYPNVWRPLSRTPAGKVAKGDPQAYRGAGAYMKITRLAEPKGALLVEAHVLYAEPHGWFDGRNLLGAKIPAVVKQKVREIRQEMLRASR